MILVIRNNKNKLKLTLYCNRNLRKLIINNKNKIYLYENSGLYEINCLGFNCEYVGQTGGSIKTVGSMLHIKTETYFTNHFLESIQLIMSKCYLLSKKTKIDLLMF